MIPSVRLIELCLIGSSVLDESEWIRDVRADSRSVHHLCPLCLLFFLSSSVSLSASFLCITFSLSSSCLMSQGDLCWPFASWLLLIWTFPPVKSQTDSLRRSLWQSDVSQPATTLTRMRLIILYRPPSVNKLSHQNHNTLLDCLWLLPHPSVPTVTEILNMIYLNC